MSIFAKRHYEWMANYLAEQIDAAAVWGERSPWRMTCAIEQVTVMCDKLAHENSAFKPQRFRKHVVKRLLPATLATLRFNGIIDSLGEFPSP